MAPSPRPVTRPPLAAQGDAGAPYIEIDLGRPYAGYAILAAMVWPHDEHARARAMATSAARLLHRAKDGRTAAELRDMVRQAVEEAAHSVGVTPEEAYRVPGLRHYLEVLGSNLRAALERATAVTAEHFEAAGGLDAVAGADSHAAIEEQMQKALDGEPRDAGFVVLNLAKLHRLHSDKAASLSSAAAVLAHLPPAQGGIDREPRTLLAHYKDHCAIAPVYAGIAAAVEAVSGRPLNPARFKFNANSLLQSRAGRERALRWAMAIQRLARGFRAKTDRYGAPALPPDKLVEYRVGVAEEEPRLLELSPAALAIVGPARRAKTGSTPRRPRAPASGLR